MRFTKGGTKIARTKRVIPPPQSVYKKRRRLLWRKIRVWKCIYVHPTTGEELIVRQLNKPTSRKRVFRAAGGNRKFKLIRLSSYTQEVIVVAKTAKKSKSTAKNKKANDTVDEDLEDLEELEDLDDLDDELDDDEDVEEDEESDDDEDEDEEEEDEEEEEDDEDEEDEEEEEPAPKKSKKSAKSKSKGKKESRAKANGRVGTQEVADHYGVDGRSLRMVLRKHGIEKDDETGRYEWSSLNHPEVKKIGKLLKGGAAREAKQEGLDRLKSGKKGKSSKKGKKSKK